MQANFFHFSGYPRRALMLLCLCLGFPLLGQACPGFTLSLSQVSLASGVVGTLNLQATDASCNTVATYTGSKTIQFYHQKVDPSTGDQSILVDAQNVNTFVGMGEGSGSAVSTTVSFVNGLAQVGLRYDDVGSVQVTAQDLGAGLAGTSPTFVIKPYDLVVTVDGVPTITTLDHTAPVFRRAGESFTVHVAVRNAQGGLTPNFGHESVSERVSVYSDQLISPVGGRNGTQNGVLLQGDSFEAESGTPGVFRNSLVSFDEVGIIQIKAQISSQNYLGAGNVSSLQAAGPIGRFTPYAFSVNLDPTPPKLQTVCPNQTDSTLGFSYLGQPLSFASAWAPRASITAVSSANTTTQNYTGAYWKLPAVLTGTMVLDTTHLPAEVAVAHASTTNRWYNPMNVFETLTPSLGVGYVEFSTDAQFTITRPITTGVNVAPFDPSLSLVYQVGDSDGIQSTQSSYHFGDILPGNGLDFTSAKQMRQGRIRLGNVSGSELLNLKMPMILEYYNGSLFIANTEDTCTAFVTTPTQVRAVPDELSKRVLTNTVPDKSTDTGVFVNAARSVLLTKGGTETPTQGYVDVTVDVAATLPWLAYPWRLGSENPEARASFGIYQGPAPIVYREESIGGF